MILTTCAACAAPLAHNAPRCIRCQTRYCGSTCQHDHWRRGHKQMCKKIHRGGNAEQYHADKKYKEAVAVAVEACAEDTKGQTCYICTQALHWKTKEGLVRMCACRGTAGFAHVSCLAEQAKILCDEAEENNLDSKVRSARRARWEMCSLCEQNYHGVVACALGWACWKLYVGRPKNDINRLLAMMLLGNGLFAAGHHEATLSVQEAELAAWRRLGLEDHSGALAVKGNLSNTYYSLGRVDECLSLRRDVYSGWVKLLGEENPQTLLAANNYAAGLIGPRRFEEVKSLLLKSIPVARRILGESHEHTLRMRWNYGMALYGNESDDDREAMTTLEDVERIARRVFGGAHPFTLEVEQFLRRSRCNLPSSHQSVETVPTYIYAEHSTYSEPPES